MRHMPDRFLRGLKRGSFKNMIPDIILKTKHLVFEKSEFLIDLKENYQGRKYLEVTQTIHQGEKVISSSLKINPKILNTLVTALLEFDDQEDKAASIPKDKYGKDLEKLKAAYLKGSTLESLRLQFPKYSVEEMETMLRNDGIVIVDQVFKPPKRKFFRKKR